ncbi:hypothetical protein NUU61_004537 [Penicillium alfredii]|uniref:SnoaL-like domain-containing protein n=1 Tax=Penicillium alfredii TaxID=1506179 RepID=A0A9W9KDD0_9EURO|nr:uncharacterized protein NUU61_004537 [Penicillium alfredii]KAJ5102315.1 hypothetical protein NUU61_004537 [Penicillium alfredii]
MRLFAFLVSCLWLVGCEASSSTNNQQVLQNLIERSAHTVAIGQNMVRFSYLCDTHRVKEMDQVFTPNCFINLPDKGFQNLHGVDQFIKNFPKYANYNFQHVTSPPVVDLDDSMTTAHATTLVIATVFDSFNTSKARPEEVEYGSYITDHVLTKAGWRIQNMTVSTFGEWDS